MQKVNLLDRVPFKAGVSNKFWTEREDIHVLLEKPGALYAVLEDQNILIGHGVEFRFRLDVPAPLFATSDGCFVDRLTAVHTPNGEVFTNFEKMPTMSPAERAVTLALRRLKAKEKELDRQRAAARSERRGDDDPEGEAVAEEVEDETPEETAS